MADQTVLALAQMLSGEVSGQPYETKVRVASTALNRLAANKPKEFGSTLPEVLQKGYYAVSNPNTPYKQAVSGNFPDEASQNDFKQNLVIAGGLVRGTIPLEKGEFYFKPKEIKGKKRPIDFSKVQDVGSDKTYKYFSY